jgi:peroxiredoxin
MIPRIFLAMSLALGVAPYARAANRAAELEQLLADFDAAQTAYDARQADFPADATDADRIDRYKSYPRWIYLPKILAIAEADPKDAAALEASKWIINQGRRVGNQWRPLYDAETTAWRVVAGQELPEEDIETLCLIAARRRSPAREEFLRTMAARTDLAGNAQAYAVAALAEYLAQRGDEAEAGGFATWWPEDGYFNFLRTQLAEPWVEYASIVEPAPYRQESAQLFQRIVDNYSDVPITVMTLYFHPDAKTLGQQATRSLHILEHLVAGAPAPDAKGSDLDGKPLRLTDYRGKVVLLSFWYSACGPCIAAVPEERELVEKFREEPFALIGVCQDSDVAVAKKTAEEHGMTWPCWFDGKPGEITGDFNVTKWPTFYLLDAQGNIVSKDVPVGKLAQAVEAALRRQPPASDLAAPTGAAK